MGLFRFAAALMAATLLASAGLAGAGDMSQHARVGDVDVYYGLVPADLIQKTAISHGGKMPASGDEHLVVALYDGATGQRITNAEVRAAIGPLGLATQWKKLEPMAIADSVTYGEYFSLVGSGIYRLLVSIRRPGMDRALETEFEFKRP